MNTDTPYHRSRYEVSAREREDEMRRHRDEFDLPEESYEDYMARLAERPRAGTASKKLSRSTGASRPGTGRSASRDEEEAA